MDWTVRRVKGTKVDADGTVIHVLMETVSGGEVTMAVLPEMVPLFMAELMNARTRALIAAEGGIPITAEGNHVRQPMAAVKVVAAAHPKTGFTLVQVLTEGGGVFEFLVPSSKLLLPKPTVG